MKKLAPALLLVLLAASMLPSNAAAQRRAPSYVILTAPARAHHGHAYYPGQAYEARTHAYAYGWFGARPRRQLRRSTGYYDSYLQWTRQ
jgi:hypothetical protein